MRQNLSTLAFFAVAGALVGALYAMFLDQVIFDRGFTWASVPKGATRGAVVALVAVSLEYLVLRAGLGRVLPKLSFAPAVLLRGGTSTIILLIALSVSHMILVGDPTRFFLWFQNGLARDYLFAGFAAFIVQFFLQTRRLIGARTLTNFLLGRYARPTHEKRIFVLADMVGSTAIADRLGDESALSLITGFFLDIDPAIRRHGGEVHAYVGDEIIISWAMRDSATNARVLACVAEIFDIIHARSAHYLETYGVAPAVRVGVSGGHVAVGECGWEKRQVVYIGDTINTAKRLQETCKLCDVPVLMDSGTADQITVPDALALKPMGEAKLRGRESPTQLVTVVRAGGPPL